MIRAFLGLPLPPVVQSALVVQQFLLPLPRKADPATLHLTLVFLGEQPDHLLEAAHEEFARLTAPPFVLELRGLGLFGGSAPRCVWAGVAPSAPLMALQAKAERAARMAGCAIDGRRFHPHVTLGRFHPPVAEEALRIERAVAEGTGFRAGPWEVREMVLWQSLLHREGARHEELARYPLGGDGMRHEP